MASQHSDFRAYQRKLERLAADVMPRVVAEALNSAATSAHIQTIRNVRDRFLTRNQYTERSVRYYKASAKSNWRKINAVTGSISDYMDEQDHGGYRLPKRGSKAPVAMLAARGGSARNVVRKRYRAGSLGENQFVGTPRGKARPAGVYERAKKNKRLRLIRRLDEDKVQIRATRWHRDGVDKYARRDWIEAAFIREARREIEKLK